MQRSSNVSLYRLKLPRSSCNCNEANRIWYRLHQLTRLLCTRCGTVSAGPAVYFLSYWVNQREWEADDWMETHAIWRENESGILSRRGEKIAEFQYPEIVLNFRMYAHIYTGRILHILVGLNFNYSASLIIFQSILLSENIGIDCC